MTFSDFITQARARLAKATKGPLEVVRFDNEGGYISYQVETRISKTRISKSQHAILGSYSDLYNPKAKADAILAANAPSDLTTALSALEIAWEALDEISKTTVSNDHARLMTYADDTEALASETKAEINRLLNEDKK